ncbi:ATP-binding protein [Streptomyces cellulosae]|uniref:ATP-binding protein n=1 Tax=Streptomyces cellulosae TaxID=1968 RepID=UPI0004C895D0
MLDRLHAQVAGLVERRSAHVPTDPLRGHFLSDDAVHHRPADRAPGPPDGPGASSGPAAGGEPASAPLPPPAGTSDGGARGLGGLADGTGGDGPPASSPTDDAADAADEDAVPAGTDGAGDPSRLRALARRLGLGALDVYILLIALAPEVERGFEALYGYLNDDLSRRRATVGMVLELCALPASDPHARSRFQPTAPLSALGLLTVEEPERPFLSRSLRVPDRLVSHLLGDDSPDALLAARLRPLPAPGAVRPDESTHQRFAARLAAGPLTAYVREQREGDGLAWAAVALAASGLEALHYRPDGVPQPAAATATAAPAPEPWRELLREARLRDCALVVSPLPDVPGPLIQELTAEDVTVLLVGRQPYDPAWADRDPLVLDAPRPAPGGVETWQATLGDVPVEAGLDLATTLAPYRLGAAPATRAARAALRLAAFDGGVLTASHIRLAARQQGASGLERYARRIRPAVGWEDLVLPEERLAQLRELALRARVRDRVLGDWRLSAGGGRGRGVLGLFAGESGTGKTLSAEVVAAELGLDLYVVQLSSVVDKYVGETEKNLERIFTEADRTDAVLLFDEADAMFGKRSEVKDSHDRYANLESAYLLQRLEAFDGVALLTTNLRANIDDAFTRRLDMVVDFPFPDQEQRLALWRHSLKHVPCEDDADPGACAREFELAGGSIRSAVVTAAYAAAGRGAAVSTADLVEGARREYRKAGRLVMEAAHPS